MSDHRVAQLPLSKAPTAAAPQKAYALVGLLRRAAIFGGATMGAQEEMPAQPRASLAVAAQPRAGLLSAYLGQ